MIKTLKEKKGLYLYWLAASICISLSIVTSNILSIIAFVLFIVASFTLSTADVLILLFGLMPFANIFKIDPKAVSLFTICEILVVLILIYKIKKIRSVYFVLLLSFIIYMFIFSLENLNILAMVKIIIAFLLIYYAKAVIHKSEIKNITYVLSFSTIASLLLSLNTQYAVYIEPYFEDLNYYVDSSGKITDIFRISGFIGDPNYFAVLIILVSSLLCLLYYYKAIGVEFWLLFGVLIVLGFFTYSKSYFLCAIALVLFLLIFVLFPKHNGWAWLSIISLTVLLFFAFSGEIEVFNLIVDRFDTADLTTGRDALNTYYLHYIINNPIITLFGKGVSASHIQEIGNIVHNSYIELLYRFGLIGSSIFIGIMLISMSGNSAESINCTYSSKKHIVCFLPILFVIIMYYFLAGITRYELPFYIIIASIALNNNLLSKED